MRIYSEKDLQIIPIEKKEKFIDSLTKQVS